MIPMLIYDQYSIYINFVYATIKIINLTNSKRCIIFAVRNRNNNLKNYTIMLSERLHAAINEQINAELWSAYLYLSMSMDAEAKGYKGVANWFYVQWLEEQDHARILANYLNSRDAKVELKPIAEVQTEWESVQDMFRHTLKHEKVVTSLINNLAAIAHEDRDFASSNMLVWFIDEQIEEEESAREMIFASESVENDKYGMYQLDKELATRVYTQASPLASSAE